MKKLSITTVAALLAFTWLSSAAPAAQPQAKAPADFPTQLAAQLQVSVADVKDCLKGNKMAGDYNSLHDFTCAYVKTAMLSLPLANPERLAQFVHDWNPSKWSKSDELQMTGVAEDERMARTFALIRRMRDALGNPEPFDYVQEPKTNAEMQEHMHPVLEGGIGAMLAQENMWQILQAIESSIPKDGLSGEEYQKRMNAARVIGPGHRLLVDSPVLNGPSWGILQSGDIIDSATDKVHGTTKMDGLSVDDAIKAIKGTPGTTVTLHILRTNSQGVAVPIDLTLLRSHVKESAVIIHDVDGIRQITLANFENENLLADFRQALVEAKQKKMKGLVISVRGNPGGRLDYVEAMLEMIVPRGEVLMSRTREPGSSDITQLELVMDDVAVIRETMLAGASDDTKDFVPVKRVEFSDDYAQQAMYNPRYVDTNPLATVIDEDMPVVVLIDGNSYSASEIFAGGIESTHRGQVIGQPTAGKNDIMAQVSLPECAAHKANKGCQNGGLSVIEGSFFPGGVNTDLTGVIPNQLVEQVKDFGKTDAQLDAGMASVNSQHDQLVARQAAADKSKQINADRFRARIKARNDNDLLPPDKQNPDLQQ